MSKHKEAGSNSEASLHDRIVESALELWQVHLEVEEKTKSGLRAVMVDAGTISDSGPTPFSLYLMANKDVDQGCRWVLQEENMALEFEVDELDPILETYVGVLSSDEMAEILPGVSLEALSAEEKKIFSGERLLSALARRRRELLANLHG